MWAVLEHETWIALCLFVSTQIGATLLRWKIKQTEKQILCGRGRPIKETNQGEKIEIQNKQIQDFMFKLSCSACPGWMAACCCWVTSAVDRVDQGKFNQTSKKIKFSTFIMIQRHFCLVLSLNRWFDFVRTFLNYNNDCLFIFLHIT